MHQLHPSSRYRFGRFEIDLDRQELSENGDPHKLPPQPWKVLELLVRNADRLVTREELQAHLWGDRAVEVDSGLNYCIRQIRQTLGESAEAPTFIETVPRRGYRFIAPVEALNGQSTQAAAWENEGNASAGPAPPERERRGRPRTVVVLLAGAMLLTALWMNRGRLFDEAGPVRLAMMPLAANGSGEEDELIAAGLTRELVTELGRLDPQRVGLVSLDASQRFLGHETPAQELRRVLGVDLLLRGSLRREEEGTRIHLWLERTADQRLVWTRRFDSGEGSQLATQRDLGERAASALAAVLGVDLGPPATRAENPREREAYLRAQYLLAKEGGREASRSVSLFEEAITADPRSARAYAGLSEAILKTGTQGEIDHRARAAARRAIVLDPELAEPHLVLAWILASHDWDWARANEEVQRALELAPDSARAHAILGYFLLREPGGMERGLAAMRRAVELDPISSTTQCDVAWAYFYARRFEEALEQAGLTLQLEPADLYAALCRIHSLLLLGREDEAVAAARTLMILRQASPSELSEVATEQESRAAMRAFWGWWRNHLDEIAGRGYPLRDFMASAALEVGDREEAMRQIELAKVERSTLLMFLSLDPRFDALRGDPSFSAAVRLVERGEAGS